MRKLIVTLSILFFGIGAMAQTTQYNETFETLPLSVSSSGSTNWARSSQLRASGMYSDSCTIALANDTAILTTNAFSTSGFTNVSLTFNHICKLEFADSALIEVSTDNGSTWIRITGNEYNGTGIFGTLNNRFNATSYLNAWQASNYSAVPQQSWWRTETFDLSAIASGFANVKLRFIAIDGNGNGSLGNYGWLIDDIKVIAASDELIPPTIAIQGNYPQDTVLVTGPFEVIAEITDNSGIAEAYLFYEVNGNLDSVVMNSFSSDIFKASIPSFSYGTTVCYHIEAIDSSAIVNIGSYPAGNCISFTTKRNPLLPTPYARDASVYSIEEPEAIFSSSNGDVPIITRIINRGAHPLTKATIKWKLDGVSQPDYIWTGNLSLDLVSQPITLDSLALASGSHQIMVKVTLPNDSSDLNTVNDSITKSVYGCYEILSGNYTLGLPTSDFPTFSDLMTQLHNCGMSGPTTINIETGTYTESLVLDDNIMGLDSVNTLTFTSSTQNAEDVTINIASGSSNVITFNKGSYITLSYLSLISNKTTGEVILFSNGSNHNTIHHCNISAPYGDYGSLNTIASSGFGNNHNTISHNKIYGGYYAIYFYCSSGYDYFNEFNHNEISEFYRYGISIYRGNNNTINYNTLTKEFDAASPNLTSLYFQYSNEFTAIGNYSNLKTNGNAYGVYLSYSNGSTSNHARFYNNISVINGTSSSTSYRACYLNNSSYLDIIGNTFITTSGSSNSETFYIGSSSASNVVIKNNIFANFGDTYAFEATANGSTNVSEMDNNCFYTTGGTSMMWNGSGVPNSSGIGAIQTATGMNTNSILTNPMFYSLANPRSFSATLSNGGSPFADNPLDIDENVRSLTNPSIGAVEFVVPTSDAGIIQILSPQLTETQNDVISIKALVQNYGSTTLTSIPVAYMLDNGTPVTTTWTGSIAPAAIDTVTFTNFTVPALGHTLQLYTSIATDTNYFNDSISTTFYGNPLIDLEVVSMNQPADGCDKTTSEVVEMTIKNIGVNDLNSGFTASYHVVGTTNTVSVNVTDTILAGGSLVYQFAQGVDIRPTQMDTTYSLILKVNQASDPNINNDSLVSQVISRAALPTPAISDTTIYYGSSAVFTLNSTDPIEWFANGTTTTKFATANPYTTPLLYDTTEYWLRANAGVAPSSATVGNANTTTSQWDNNIYGGNGSAGRYQLLYTASELSALGLSPGEIESIAFNADYAFTSPQTFEIKMANVTVTSLTGTFVNASPTTVFNGVAPGIAGWNTHVLTSPFIWDGTSNLLVEVCATGISFFAPSIYYTTTSFNSHNIAAGFGASCTTASGSVNTTRPNTYFVTKSNPGCKSAKTSVTVNVPWPQFDAELADVVSPVSSCGISQSQVSIAIFNSGTDTLASGFQATYRIDNGAYVTPETVTTAIAPRDTLIFTFSGMANFPSGANGQRYSITAKVINAVDTYSPNDSLMVDSILSKYTPANPVFTTPISINYGNTATLTASATDTVFYYADMAANQRIGYGNPFTTDILYDTTTYYVGARRYISNANYQLGTGTAINGQTGPSPYGADGYGAKNQFLIRASELRAKGMIQGNINSIAFNVLSVRSNIMRNYTIKIGSTSRNDLNTYTFVNNLTTVYGPSNFAELGGWNTHTFSTPFYWDGESNIIIETCFKGTSTLSYAVVESSTTTFVSSASSSGFNAFDCSSLNINNSFSSRPNIIFNHEGLGLCNSDLLPLDINVTNFPTVDATLVQFVEPTSASIIAGNSDVKVVLKNNGLTTLTAATINWSEKGILNTPFAWTGSLARGEIDTVIIAPNYAFAGGTALYEAWVVATGDNISSNDSVQVTARSCMNGVYTIGVSNRDYSNFTNAINDLISCTVCGPVTFNVDSGYYSDRVIMPNIGGTNASNTITFQSATLDSTDVVLNVTNNSLQNFVWLFDGAQYVNIHNMSFVANGSQYGNVFVLENNAKHINFRNNVITSTNTTVNQPDASNIFVENHFVSNIIIDNNMLYSGAQSVRIEGLNTNPSTNVQITNNQIIDYINHAIYLKYIDTMMIVNNNMYDMGIHTAAYGVYGYYINNGFNFSNNTIDLRSSQTAYGFYLYANGTANNRGLISNNMISINSGNSTKYGIYINSGGNTDIVYNSINITAGSASGTVGIKMGSGSSYKILNNNVYVSQGYAISVNTPSAMEVMDYNNYYSADPTLFAQWGTTNIADLTTLISYAPTKNLHSVKVLPDYISPINLHSEQISLYNAGIAFPRVTTDIDGDARKAIPSIGADEFTPPAIDLSLDGFTYPILSDCGYSVSDSVVVKVTNRGINDLNFANTPATISIQVSGISTNNIVFPLNNGSLVSGASANYVVSTTMNLSTNGEYIFNGFIQINGDGKTSNDTMNEHSIISYPVINTFPFVENFESGQNITFKTTHGIEASTRVSSFAARNSNFGLQMDGGAFSSWLLPSNPTVDNAFLNNPEHVAKAASCMIDATSVTRLSLKFDLRQTVYNIGKENEYSWMRVLLTDANGTYYLKNVNGDSVFQPQTVNYDPFATQTFSLDAYTGQAFSISFEACNRYGYGQGNYNGDNVLIDNITIWEPDPIDLGLNSIIQGNNFGPIGSLSTVKIAVENYGTDTLRNIPLAYTINNGGPILDTLFGVLAPADQDTFTFATGFGLVAGNSLITAYATYPGDIQAANDTARVSYKGLNTFYPNFSDDFEGADNWMSVGTFNQFELGTPTTSYINTAHSGSNAWTSRLNANYLTSSTEYLYSPYFVILPYTDSITVSFWQMIRFQANQAYGTFEYSHDGTTWSSIGYIGIPNSNNWYNANDNGQHKWNMVNNAWNFTSIKLNPTDFNTGARVQFRFKMETKSFNLSEEGWAIDDFKLFFPPLRYDAGVTTITTPNDTIQVGSTQVVKIKIKNFGTDTIINVPVSYKINGIIQANETYNDTILPNEVVDYTFSTTFTAVAATNEVCASTAMLNDMQSINNSTCLNLTVEAAQFDAGVSRIVAPFGQATMGQATQVQVYIKNYGTDPIQSLDVAYYLQNVLKSQETYSTPINAGDSALYTFSTTFVSPAGNYTLYAKTILTTDANMTNDSAVVHVIGTGIGDANANEFAVGQNQPNPVKNHTVIDYYLPKAGIVSYRLTSVLGQEVINFESQKSQGKYQWQIDTQNLKAGVYYYTITFEDKSVTYKMAVIK